MSLIFDGTLMQVGHLHEHLSTTGGELQTSRVYFWGLRGTSEIVGSPTFWTVTARVWINAAAFTARGLLNDYIEELRLMRGDHGTLLEKLTDGTVSESWEEATFDGFEETAFAGARSPGPLQDVSSSLHPGATWFTQGTMKWTLLTDIRGAT